MAKLTIKGLDEAENKLKTLAQNLRGEAMQNMLYAGAEVLEDAWRGEISERHHIVSGSMMQSIGRTGINVGRDGLEISVYPQGTDSHRITNAQKAYILHYGRNPTSKGTKAIKGDKFVTAAEKKAKPAVNAAMQAVLDEYVSGNGG
jgi:hypothetical protein